MIKFDEQLQEYVDFLEERYPSDETVHLKPLYGHDSVSLESDPTVGWAVYIPKSRTIALPMDVPEAEADEFADRVLEEYKLWKQENIAGN